MANGGFFPIRIFPFPPKCPCKSLLALVPLVDFLVTNSLPMSGKLSYLVINPVSMTHCDDSDHLSPPINCVYDSKSLHPKFPESLKFPDERLSTVGIFTQGSNCRLDALFEVWREMADDFGNVRGNIRPKGGHYRRRFLEGRSGSPNTSSNENPLLPAA